jgi:hypothetical protein
MIHGLPLFSYDTKVAPTALCPLEHCCPFSSWIFISFPFTTLILFFNSETERMILPDQKLEARVKKSF